MSRIAVLMLAASFSMLRANAGESISITNWIRYSRGLTPPYTTTANSSFINLTPSGKVDSAYFSQFKPLPLEAGKSVTFSARLVTPQDFPERSGGQIRIGLYGVTAGTNPDTVLQSDLRGFVLMGGVNGKNWLIELHEHASPTGSLIHLNGLAKHSIANEMIEVPRGLEKRVVLTVARKSAELVTISGFWADMPFTFDIKPLAGDYTHLRALVLMRGNASGTSGLIFSDVRIRSD